MPMQLNVPIDAADAVREWLSDHGVRACAEPLPRDLAAALPITLVQTTGGGRDAVVLDRHAVRLYTWAETQGEAIAECSRALAALEAAAGETIGGVPCYRVTPYALPYPAHDPDHPDIPRAAVTADVYARALTIEQ